MIETPMEAIDRRAREGRVPVILGDLFGPAGNAWSILGTCRAALREWDRATQSHEFSRWEEIHADATSSDYRHLLEVVDREFRVMAVDHRGRPVDYPEWLDDYDARMADVARELREEDDR